MSKEKYGVHIAHCCYIHGCKYGDKDCPVVSGEVAQKHICYDCDEENEPYTLEEIELLRKTKSYRPTYKQLKQQLAEKDLKIMELQTKLNLKEHRPAFCTLADRECEALGKVEQLKQQLALYEQSNKVLNDQLNKSTEHIGELEDYYTGYTEALVTENLELKQQLAEKQKEKIEYTDTINFVETSEPDIVAKELDRLNQQLAEKEKQIEYLDKSNKLLRNVWEVDERNKISFAIEQLEQLKHDIWTDQQDDGWLDEQVDIYFLTETIDNQIKRLTHQHEDKGE